MREQIVEYLNRKIVGPDPNPEPSHSQVNGEEILFNDSPLVKYGAGVLYPQKTVNEEHLSEEDERDEAEALEDEDTSQETEGASSSPGEPEVETEANSEEDDGSGDDAIGLANAFKPSAMGISFMVEIGKPDALRVEIKAGQYKTEKYNTEETAKNGRQKIKYLRRQITAVENLTFENLTQDDKITTIKRDVKPGGEGIGLKLFVLSRSEGAASTNESEKRLITVSLVNNKSYEGGRHKVEDCFFQVSFKITEASGKKVFIEYPENKGEKLGDEEKALKLLYRHKKTYAIGHGCAADWEEADGDASAFSVSALVLPSYDVKPIIPENFKDLKLSMLEISSLKPESDPFPELNSLCDKYEKWIEERNSEVPALEESLQPVAENNLKNCRNCLRRMRSGIETLQTDERAMRAFRLMNEAILLQQLHYSLGLREWKKTDDELEIPPVQFPDPEKPMKDKGSWYPFQLAFILMNINSINDPFHKDRKIADLIWFPTGGGKTEAYLGLTAFLLFLRRLKNSNNAGVTVLMRYTLRLLTTQQFQRAATLICACEYIRKENTEELGEKRYSIGLWVGGSLTPNNRKDARSKLNKLSEGKTKENPFVVLRCPWCAAQMGGTDDGVKGYKSSSSPKTVKFVCGDKDCEFSSRSFSLPLYVIDEDIYEYKPSLMISTVDKFAMMPWKSETRSFFAKDGSDHTPPELIIQDELHLISGPLGSMVGHYETVIDEFCTDYSKENPVRPKIIASTATIRRAEKQVSALFNRKIFQFPPQALKAGDSFFAREDAQSDGRTYIGVHASAFPSQETTQVRVFSALLQAVKSMEVSEESERDPYYTLIAYFNNLRELGHAATLITANIREYMRASLWHEPPVEKERKRYIKMHLELTSRKSGNEITKALQDLERKYDNEKKAVDICLATNMISVGLDVSRLGLMAVVGQPKTTSEYIQATSRVGRSKDAPGLVITIYNPGRPRDRSHYEHFKTYHSKLYKQVEPTSVTPWAVPVRKRALHALVVAIVRILGSEENSKSPDPAPNEDLRKKVYRIIEDRITEIKNKDEVRQIIRQIKSEIKHFLEEKWERFQPKKYGGFGKQTEEAPLMYSAGSFPNPVWKKRAKGTPNSMRFVDRTCQIDTIKKGYPNLED